MSEGFNKYQMAAAIVCEYIRILKPDVDPSILTEDDIIKLTEAILVVSETYLQYPKGINSEKQIPAVPIKKSVQPEYITCLEDGKHFKSLKRHLRTAYGMTPEEYREKWNLPSDYPMVAPAYATRRSALAKEMGLGSFVKRRAADG